MEAEKQIPIALSKPKEKYVRREEISLQKALNMSEMNDDPDACADIKQSQEPDAVTEAVENEKEVDANQENHEEVLNNIVASESVNEEAKSPAKKAYVLSSTLKEAQKLLGTQPLGRTRSQDRKRSLKRTSIPPTVAPKRGKEGRWSSKRKRK